MAFVQFLRRLLQRRIATPQELSEMKRRMLEAKKRAVEKRLEAIERRANLSAECQLLDREASRLEAEFRRAAGSAAERNNVAPSETEKPQPQKKEDADPQQKLWSAESSSAMRSLITSMTEQDLTDLVGAIEFAVFPLNGLASAGGFLDKRSTLTVHATFQLLIAGKHSQANQLLNKILDKMRAKLATGARERGVVSQGREQAFESAFAAGDMRSATEILKQNRSTDFWRIDEMLKRELYDLSKEMLTNNRPKEAAILLDAVMLDYPHDLDTEFWRAAAYHNIFNSNKSDNQAKHNAKQAIGSFLNNAEGNQQYAQKCSDLSKIMSEQYSDLG